MEAYKLKIFNQSDKEKYDLAKKLYLTHTVNGQNITGIYIIPLTLIQLTDKKQNLVCNNWWLKLQPAVML